MITPTEIEKKADEYAKSLLAQAVQNEPLITEDLQKIALEISAEIVGLEHKFKTRESLTRKLIKNSQIYFSYISDYQNSDPQLIEKSVARTAKQSNDVLRYTFLLPLEKYAFCFKRTLTELANLNYTVSSKHIWNAWKNIGTKFDKGYRGINVTIISSQGQKFELQFHTEESFQLKRQTHNFYKEAGLGTVSKNRKEELIKIMIEEAENISTPKGVAKL